MDWQYTPYTYPLLGAAAITTALAFYTRRRRAVPGAAAFAGTMLAVAVWSLGYALELSSTDMATKLWWARVQYLGIVSAPLGALIFAIQYTDRTRWLTRRNLILLAVPPAVALLLVWTNGLHHLVWTSIRLETGGSFSVLALTHGVGFGAIVIYAYCSLLIGAALVFQTLFRRPNLYRGQVIALLIAALVPWTGNVLYVTGLNPFPFLDLTPLAFTLSGLAMVVGLFRFRLLDIVPVARDAILDSMDDAVIVLDVQGRIVDLNPAAERLVGRRSAAVIGQPAAQAFAALPALAQRCSGVVEEHGEITLESESEARRIYEFRGSPLRDQSGRTIGQLVDLRDITERRRAAKVVQDSELRYRILFEASTDAIFLETLDGHVLDCNAAACEMLGYSREELVQLTVADLVPEDVARTLADVITTELATGGLLGEATNKRKNGQVFPVEVSTRMITIGEEQLVIAYVRDISERKRLEQQSYERRLYLESVLACAPDAIVTLDAQGQIMEWNRGAEELFGYPRDETLGRDLDSLVTGSNEQATEEAIAFTRQVLARETIRPTETVRYRRDGTPVNVILTGAPILVEGEVAGVVAIYTDLAERKRSERIIRESEEKYRTLVEQSLQGLVIVQNYPPQLIFANPAMAHILGYTVEELLSLSPDGVRALVHPEYQAVFFQRYQERLVGRAVPARYELQAVRKDGTVRWVEMLASRIEVSGRPAVQATFMDITERKHAEQEERELEKQREQAREALRRRNRELALINRVIAASAASQETEPILETVCRELAEAFDFPHSAAALLREEKTEIVVVAEHRADGRASVLGQAVPVTEMPLARDLSERKLPLMIDDARSDPRLGCVRDLIPPDEPLPLLFLPILIEGEVVGGLGMAAGPRPFSAEEVDLAWHVAEQVSGALARARLAEAERRLSTAVDQAAEAVMVTDARATIEYVNPAFERVVGYSRAEIVGRPSSVLNSDRLDQFFQEEMWQAETGRQAWHERFDYTKHDGRVRNLDLTVAPVREQSGEIVSYVVTMRDATREAQLEAEFQQAQKMEALGRLAGGVAHDFNNLLTIIKGSAQLLEYRLRPGDPLLQNVRPIRETVDRAAKLTAQLVSFSRREVIRPDVLNLNQVVSDLSSMLRRVIDEDVQLMTVLADDLWPIEADPTQIDQVIANLVVNARDAMPGGGVLTIETSNVVLDAAYAELCLGAEPGEYVLLSVSDTGVGMDEEVKARIFEPFFTTKQKGEGSGLGLATVFGIVTQSRGRIEVYSEVGLGTTFKIYWPRVAEREPLSKGPAYAPGWVPSRLIRGVETVLVVEDDTEVRELAVRVLESCGYHVLAAGDALEALQIAERHTGPIHLLLSDVVLPYLRGNELARKLLEARPQMGVLYISGYTDGAIAQHGVLHPDVSFLSKPFSIEDLTRTVREVLDSQGGPE